MQDIKELKKEAYQLAMATYGCGYRYSADVRTEAMKTYALLTIAESMSKQNESEV